MSPRIKFTIRVTQHNPKLQSVKICKTEAEYYLFHIVGVVKLPPSATPGDPEAHLLTVQGPVEVHESYESVIKKLDEAMESMVEVAAK